jgi:signal transduction histidine kinase
MFNVHHIFQIHWIWGEVLRTMQQAGDTLQVVRLDRIGVTLEEENKAFVKMTVTPLRDNCGMGYIFMGEDITGRLVLEHELAQAQKLESIGQLAAGIAHELNTPIQFVGDNVRFLSDSFADLHAALTRYREILAAAKSGRRLPPELVETCEAELQQIDLDFLCDETPKAFAQTAEGINRVATIVRAMKPGNHVKAMVDLNKAIESTVVVARNEWKYVAELAAACALSRRRIQSGRAELDH